MSKSTEEHAQLVEKWRSKDVQWDEIFEGLMAEYGEVNYPLTLESILMAKVDAPTEYIQGILLQLGYLHGYAQFMKKNPLHSISNAAEWIRANRAQKTEAAHAGQQFRKQVEDYLVDWRIRCVGAT